jgi:hypothetical protein
MLLVPIKNQQIRNFQFLTHEILKKNENLWIFINISHVEILKLN